MRAADPSIQHRQPLPHHTHAVAYILTQQPALEFLQPFRHLAAVAVPGGVELVLQLIHPLLAARQGIAHPGKGRGSGKPGKALLGAHQQVAAGLVQTPVQLLQPLLHLVLRLGEQFRRGGGCGRAQVGDKIGDGEVGFVADGGDHRQLETWQWPGPATRC